MTPYIIVSLFFIILFVGYNKIKSKRKQEEIFEDILYNNVEFKVAPFSGGYFNINFRYEKENKSWSKWIRLEKVKYDKGLNAYSDLNFPVIGSFEEMCKMSKDFCYDLSTFKEFIEKQERERQKALLMTSQEKTFKSLTKEEKECRDIII